MSSNESEPAPRRPRLLSRLVGELSWNPPPWASGLGRGVVSAAGWMRRNPKRLVLGLGVLVALLVAGNAGYTWYQNRPKPVTYSVSCTSPSPTPIEERAQPAAISIQFGGSVARLEQVGKVVTAGIRMTPETPGEWRWANDQILTFTPSSDWAVGQAYKVVLDKSLFPDHVRLETYETGFASAPFTASISELRFYEDPRNPADKHVVATIAFSHPVDPATLVRNLSLRPKDQKRGLLGWGSLGVPFQVTYDKLKGQAYVHSEPMPIPENTTVLTLTMDVGVRAARGGPATTEAQTQDVSIPGMFTYFHVNDASVTLVRNDRFEPEQVMVLNLTTGVTEPELRKNLSVWVLPKDLPAKDGQKAVRNYTWSSPSLIGQEWLTPDALLKLDPVPTDREQATLHSFRVQADVGRYVYVRVKKGTRSAGGYVLAEDFNTVIRVPAFPQEVSILHDGALLSLAGEKKLTVLARDVPALRFEVGRVLPGQINHLVSQSYGQFAHPMFSSYSFGEDNMTERFSEVRPLEGVGRGKAQYAAFDLAPYLSAANDSSSRRGLFFFRVESWDPEAKRAMGRQDNRLVLVTNLGLVVKDNADGSHDVFVQGLDAGAPVEGVTVSVLGRNGIAVVNGTTDAQGHAALPRLNDFRREQQPTVYLARKGDDFAFLPYDRGDRQLNFSRFDIGGLVSGGTPDRLTAFMFSDRGLYRPGDTFHVGMMVKSSDWNSPPVGVPLEVAVLDPRGLEVHKQKVVVSAAGLDTLDYSTEETSPTGNYQVNLYVVKDHQRGSLLGSTSVRVEEFLPDRMRITTRFSAERADGWVSPKDLKGRVTLKNLFGIAAAGRRVASELVLSPTYPSFRAFPGYQFRDPLQAKEQFNERLADATTNDEGEVEVDLGLEKYAKATWRLSFLAEGYEAEGGRGVSSEASVLVSPLPYLVGFKPDGNLRFLSQGSDRTVDFIAVDPALKKLAVKGLKAQLVEQRWVSVLTQQSNGTYQYQSARRDSVVRTTDLNLSEAGLKFSLPTEQPGDFVVVVKNAEDLELSRVEYSVAGHGNLTRALEKNAELEVKLNRPDYAAGDEIQLNIKAPYTGAGLITIERDRVYAWKWFKTDATSSVQTIQLPAGIEGNAYVNVAFVRAMDSQEIFMSPLSYGVAAFSVSRANRVFDIQVESPDKARPGEPYRIKYRGNHKGKAVLYAVDEGILQVANYGTPDPLAHFFKKRALEVRTSQILDLLLPEFSVAKAVSAMGGDAEGMDAIGKNLNPFKRKRDKPVAYWSGVVDIDSTERELVYAVPDSFNGELRVMAVAVAPEAVGAMSKRATIRGPFVITPNVPTFVAPGDEFSVGVAVANSVEGSGKGAEVTLELKPSDHLEVVDAAKRPLKIDEGREASTTFRVRAKGPLGSATLAFTASLGRERVRSAVDLSVRPAVPFLTTVSSAQVSGGKQDLAVSRKLYDAYRTLEVSASPLPLGLARGLTTYLDKYPYGCTEQLVSRAFPAVVLKGRREFGMASQTIASNFDTALHTLRGRQNEEGAFGLWAANSYAPTLTSVYAMHFLTDAKERGFAVPTDLFNRGMTWLGNVAARTPSTLADARAVAYAQYILARNGKVPTPQVNALRERLDSKLKDWPKDLTAAYLSATYKLLKQERQAEQALGSVKLGQVQAADYAALYDGLVYDSQVLYLLSRHFPERVSQVSGEQLAAMARPINEERFNTLSSSYAILGLDAYATALGAQGTPSASGVAMLEQVAGKLRPLTVPEGLFPRVAFSPDAAQVRVESPASTPLFVQVTQAGYDLETPTKAIQQRLEVQRELQTLDGKVTHEAKLGEELEVHVKLRALDGDVSHVAITDLLPGGFEVVLERHAPAPGDSESHASEGEGEGDSSEHDGASEEGEDVESFEPAPTATGFVPPVGSDKSSWRPEYVDVREDRVVLYGRVGPTVSEYVYRVKATNSGKFVMPPAFAEGMYDRGVRARSVGEQVSVVAP
ncbi:alpha-2-macroglobulin [Corallococcus sp. H22C18031201]|nr:alpha-2-macroglobulin [Corallococcus sp. H22C18031201]